MIYFSQSPSLHRHLQLHPVLSLCQTTKIYVGMTATATVMKCMVCDRLSVVIILDVVFTYSIMPLEVHG